jgi:hypothetical protein
MIKYYCYYYCYYHRHHYYVAVVFLVKTFFISLQFLLVIWRTVSQVASAV